MSSSVPGSEWHARTLRAWQLAMLRFAVTLDNADRLAVMAIANEIDRLGPRARGQAGFWLFSPDQCGAVRAILQPNELTPAVLRQYLARIDDDRLSAFSPQPSDADEPKVSSVAKAVKRDNDPFRGLSSRGNQQVRGCAGRVGLAHREVRRRPRKRDSGHAFRAISVRDRAYSDVRLIRPARAVPGGTEKRHDGGDDLAQEGNQSGCGERGLRHVTPHARQK